jgi:hypothetical protein
MYKSEIIVFGTEVVSSSNSTNTERQGVFKMQTQPENGEVAAQSGTTVEYTVTYMADNREHQITQRFHEKYLVNGIPRTSILAVVQEVHKQLHYIADILGLEYGRGRDPNLEMLCTCRELKTARINRLRDVLIAISMGTFSFECQKGVCPKYRQCPQKRDLTAIRIAVPEANACTWYRQWKEGYASIPVGKRTGIL